MQNELLDGEKIIVATKSDYKNERMAYKPCRRKGKS